MDRDKRILLDPKWKKAPTIGSLYKHFKGGHYTVLDLCVQEKTEKIAVKYTNASGASPIKWIRDLDEWEKPLDEYEKVQYRQAERFTHVSDLSSIKYPSPSVRIYWVLGVLFCLWLLYKASTPIPCNLTCGNIH